MGEIIFNQKLCVKCGTCAAVCPVRIISQPAKDVYPSIPEDRKAFCLQCGHCEAFCPHAAVEVSLDDMLVPAAFPQQTAITPEQAAYCFSMRRSIRCYKPKPVGRPIIDKMLDIIRYAPSGINHQPLHWTIIATPEEVKKLTIQVVEIMRQMVRDKSPIAVAMNFQNLVMAWDKGDDLICRHAPHLLIAHARKDDRVAPLDATIALAQFEMMAPVFKLGTCWAGYFSIVANLSPAIRQAAGLPADHNQLGTLMVGYPQFIPYRAPKRKKAVVTWK